MRRQTSLKGDFQSRQEKGQRLDSRGTCPRGLEESARPKKAPAFAMEQNVSDESRAYRAIIALRIAISIFGGCNNVL